MTLFHSLSHAAHADDVAHTPCIACHLLDQPAPATIDTKIAIRQAPQFEWVCEVGVQADPTLSEHSPQSAAPRGPPALLVV